jgi:L-ascorbate metabolism protein UlaG (beta-lactamase superfamily)
VAAVNGPVAAVLFAGNAQVPERWGPGVPLTLTPEAAVEAARILDPAVVVPVHQEGWAHFMSGPEELERAFADAGLAGRLHPAAPGGRVEL